MSVERWINEKYSHAPGSFNVCVDALAIPGEPEASMLIRRLCRQLAVWPEQLFGIELAVRYGALGYEPLSTGRCERPNSSSHVVMCRRLIWRGLYGGTGLPVDLIAALFGYSASTVRPWAMSWRPFEKTEGAEWWRYWGPTWADAVGVPLDVAYDPVAEAEAATWEAL